MKTKAHSLSLIVTLVASSGLLFGQNDQPKYSPFDINKDGKVTREESTEFFTQAFKNTDKNLDGVLTTEEASDNDRDALDLDHDGIITQGEYLKKRDFQFNRLDQDADGVWSEQEIANPKHRPVSEDEVFSFRDKNADGKISEDENKIDETFEFKRIDKNKDGVLTTSEFTDPVVFKRIDADGDGQITEEEYVGFRTNQFRSRDKNADGFVDKEENKN